MSWKIWATTLLLSLALSAPAWGQEAGLVLDETDAKRLAEDLRDLQTSRSVVETQRSELSAKDDQINALRGQVEALQAAARSQELNYVRMEERDRMRQENQAALVQVLQESRQTLVDTRALLQETLKQNRSLQRELFWTRLLGPLFLVGGFFLGGL